MTRDDNALSPEIRFHLIRRMERLKVIALAGPELMEHEARYLGFHRVAGVILFERNIHSLAQVTELIAAVGEALGDGDPPPLIMADHEGDFVAELKQIIGVPPAALAIAATGDGDLARQVAFETGEAMKKLGLNTVLAPVGDCYFDPGSPITGLRTFGRDPARVAEFVARTIEGFHDAGVLACAKHFPGHGATPEDSHETLPEVPKSRDELVASDLVPFGRAIDEGVDLMMMSHVAYPLGGDDLIPASFDARIIRGLLRDEMGYGGVVITDALEMAGARWYTSSRFGSAFAGGADHALLSGVDLLLHSRPVPERVQMEGETETVLSVDVIETIMKTLDRVVDPERIDEKLAEAAADNEALASILEMLAQSHQRVVDLRSRIQPPAGRPRGGESKVISFDAYPSIPHVYRSVAERSVAALPGWDGFTPFDGAGRAVIMPVEWHASGSLHRQGVDEFIDVLGQRFPHWRRTGTVLEFTSEADGSARPVLSGSGGVIDAARFTGGANQEWVDVGGDEELILLLSARGTPGEEFLAALSAFAEETLPAAVLVTGWPVFDWVPESTPGLWTIGASPQVAGAVARILAGEMEPAALDGGLIPPAGTS